MTTLLTNAPSYLTIPTYDGSNQPIHESIIDFLTEHGMSNWCGYRYWLAFTPLPGGSPLYEDPSLVASNDGINWVVPNGLTNPINKPAFVDLTHYNSDVEIVYNPDENCIMVYFRYAIDGDHDEIKLVKFYSNFTKSSVYNLFSTSSSIMTLSPTVWRESATKWHMWSVRQPVNVGEERRINYRFSTDGINWGAAVLCSDPFVTFNYGGYVWGPWHIECKYNKWENRVEFFVASNYVVSPGVVRNALVYLQCPADNLTALSRPFDIPILDNNTNVNAWDGVKLYRSSFVIERQTSQYLYKLWYSGSNQAGQWHVGYTEGALGTTFMADISAEEPMYFGPQFDITTFDTTISDYFPATYARSFSPVTLTVDLLRKITQSITNLTDSKRIVTNDNTLNADTNRKITNTNTLNPDTKRIVRVSQLLQVDTRRLVSALVTTASDTLRQVVGANVVTSTVDTIRRIIVSDSGQSDTKRKSTNTDIIRGDTKRSVRLSIQNAVDTVRGVTNDITNSIDTLRQIVNLHITVLPLDTLRKVTNSQFIRVDTKRSVWKQVQTLADTIRRFFTGGAWPVTLETIVTARKVDLDIIPRKVVLEVDGKMRNIVVTAGNTVNLKATFYDTVTGLPADPAGAIKFIIFDEGQNEIENFSINSSQKTSDGVYCMDYTTPRTSNRFLYWEASSTLGEVAELDRKKIELKWVV